MNVKQQWDQCAGLIGWEMERGAKEREEVQTERYKTRETELNRDIE